MKQVIIALGSNIEPKLTYLKQAIDHVSKLNYVSRVKASSVYQTAPVGYENQDDFFNMVARLEIMDGEKSPHELLEDLQTIELDLKRKRLIKNGPRTIDLDILLVDDQEIYTDDLVVPHPRMHERAFVLVPLAEIADDYLVPGLNKQVTDLKVGLNQADVDEVESLGNLQTLLETKDTKKEG